MYYMVALISVYCSVIVVGSSVIRNQTQGYSLKQQQQQQQLEAPASLTYVQNITYYGQVPASIQLTRKQCGETACKSITLNSLNNTTTNE